MDRTLRPGRPTPLGAMFDGEGVNFAVYSETATGVDLCLFDGDVEQRLPLYERTAHVWHGYVPGLKPGQRYGFRARGDYDPSRGLLFNPHKLLVDPYARALDGKVDYEKPVFAYAGSPVRGYAGTSEEPNELVLDTRDSAGGVPKSVVVDDRFDWAGDTPPGVPWPDTILYEAHVKSLSATHPDVPEALRGTYLALASEPVIEHLLSLGVTTLELMPVHESVTEWPVSARGKANYWGYATLGYFAPDQRFASARGNQVDEFKRMVRRLHRAGIEVVLDVVYNHTAEGDHRGPFLSMRGLDNRSYYRLQRENLARYEDYTGCGNSLNVMHPQTQQLIMDSLRYWVTEMHVDGFRFDLASTLARGATGFDKLSTLMNMIHQDPVLSNVKLIAEPWDLGHDGYQVGNFPVRWSEWNGRYRDAVRQFWTGEKKAVAEMGYRLTGSSDLYALSGRRPQASINYVTSHDGFTLRDLVSYERKHNEDNGEENRDGTDQNYSWNGGVEGPSTDRKLEKLRARQQRNFFVTLLLSQGVPMLSSGDELGKTQHGNNNAFVHDSPLSWLDWSLSSDRRKLLDFVRQIAAFRRRHPVFRRASFLRGEKTTASALPDITWFRPDGREMGPEDWQSPLRACLTMILAGDALDWRDERGERIVDDTFLILLNGSHDDVQFTLPTKEWGSRWALRIDTTHDVLSAGDSVEAATRMVLPRHTAMVYKRMSPARGAWTPTRSTKGGF